MKALVPFHLTIAAILLAGCASEPDFGDEEFLSNREQKSALAKTKSPQYFGFGAFPVQGGIGYRGTARLHPNQVATMDLKRDDIPVIDFRGKSRRDNGNVLLDTSSMYSWVEFDTAQDLDVTFMGMKESLAPYPGQHIGGAKAYAGVIDQIRLDQLFIDNIPMYVRMARGSLGPMARGIYDPPVDMVLGYDVLGLFETIQINLREGTVQLSPSHPYRPNEDLLMSQAQIIPTQGYGLVIDGSVYGRPSPIVIDLAGDYDFMRSDKKVNQTKQVSLGQVVFRHVPTTYLAVDGVLPRAGRRMLENYIITICPNQGYVYLERYPE